jgi:hypothetical protein
MADPQEPYVQLEDGTELRGQAALDHRARRERERRAAERVAAFHAFCRWMVARAARQDGLSIPETLSRDADRRDVALILDAAQIPRPREWVRETQDVRDWQDRAPDRTAQSYTKDLRHDQRVVRAMAAGREPGAEVAQVAADEHVPRPLRKVAERALAVAASGNVPLWDAVEQAEHELVAGLLDGPAPERQPAPDPGSFNAIWDAAHRAAVPRAPGVPGFIRPVELDSGLSVEGPPKPFNVKTEPPDPGADFMRARQGAADPMVRMLRGA